MKWRQQIYLVNRKVIYSCKLLNESCRAWLWCCIRESAAGHTPVTGKRPIRHLMHCTNIYILLCMNALLKYLVALVIFEVSGIMEK